MQLTQEELRVLACLIEKSHTTPDQYPLSSNALTSACNQKTSREPVVDYSMKVVDETLLLLREGGWVRSVRGVGNRAFKHKHVIEEKLGLGPRQQAVFAVLALRGPQSAGELKTRTERYIGFDDPAAVEDVLEGMAAREDPLVRNIGRGSGQSQDRWMQLLGDADAPVDAGPAVGSVPPAGPVTGPPPTSPATVRTVGGGESKAARREQIERLEQRVADLEARLATIESELGM